MTGRRAPLLMALGAGVAAGVGYPLLDLAGVCREPVSEACVWGRAYLPLVLAVSLVVVGGTVAGLLFGILAWRRRRAPDDGPV